MKQFPKIDCKTVSCIGDSITAGYYDEEGLGWVSRLSAIRIKIVDKSEAIYYNVKA